MGAIYSTSNRKKSWDRDREKKTSWACRRSQHTDEKKTLTQAHIHAHTHRTNVHALARAHGFTIRVGTYQLLVGKTNSNWEEQKKIKKRGAIHSSQGTKKRHTRKKTVEDQANERRRQLLEHPITLTDIVTEKCQLSKIDCVRIRVCTCEYRIDLSSHRQYRYSYNYYPTSLLRLLFIISF